ncbi:2Fe-2S iron-sulfur cluster-binding protein, partial [Frankia canadensis]
RPRYRGTRSGVRPPPRGGVLMPSGCRMGVCHSCLAPLAGGRVRDLRTGEEHGTPGDLIQTCVSAATGDVDVDL